MNHANQILAHIAASREAEKNVTRPPWTKKKLNINVVTIPGGKITIHHETHPDDVFDRDVRDGLVADTQFVESARTELPKCWEALEVLTNLAEFIKEECDWEIHLSGGDARIGPSIEEALSKVNSILNRA